MSETNPQKQISSEPIDRLVDALENQTKAINSLVESNSRLLQCLMEVDEVEAPTRFYIDGTPMDEVDPPGAE